ncbi:MAG: ion channel [Aquiluna sp.]
MSHSIGDRIERREPLFGWFLLATLLPILVMPFTNLEGNAIQRVLLPLSTLWLVVLALRMMPADLLRWRGWSFSALYRVLGVLCVAVMWLPFVLGHHAGHAWHLPILSVISGFYLSTTVGIVLVLAQVKRVNEAVLCLGAAGYIQLGLTGGQLATALEILSPGSFSLGRMLPGEELVERLSYFSFVTLGSLGYGDVLPATALAESFAVLLSVTATLYITLMIGLLLSRYIETRTPR